LNLKTILPLPGGPYEIISVVDENADRSPYTIKGKLIDLFDPEIPVLDKKQVNPGSRHFYTISAVLKNPETPQVLATRREFMTKKRTKKCVFFCG